MISADVEADTLRRATKNNRTGSSFNLFYKKYIPSKLELESKTGTFNFAWYSMQVNIVHKEWVGGLLSVTNIIC